MPLLLEDSSGGPSLPALMPDVDNGLCTAPGLDDLSRAAFRPDLFSIMLSTIATDQSHRLDGAVESISGESLREADYHLMTRRKFEGSFQRISSCWSHAHGGTGIGVVEGYVAR